MELGISLPRGGGLVTVPTSPGTLSVVIQDRTDLPTPFRPKMKVTPVPLGEALTFFDEAKEISLAMAIKFWLRRGRYRRWLFRHGKEVSGVALLALAHGFATDHGLPHAPLLIGAISSAIATSFKQEVLVAGHNLTNGQDALKTALYTSSATLGASTTAYATTNEVTGTGYTAGGTATSTVTPTTSGTTAFLDLADISWTTASFTARGQGTYNTTKSNKWIFSIDYGSDQTVTAGTFSVVWPTADSSSAIIRLS